MSETKPQKKIVSKRRYMLVMGKQMGISAGIGILLCIGLSGLGFMQPQPSDPTPILPHWFRWVGLLLSIYAFWKCIELLRAMRSIEPVQPVTERNAHLLPLQDTLVRSSDLPPSEQQAELLRAVQTGQETPLEELLRSVTGDE